MVRTPSGRLVAGGGAEQVVLINLPTPYAADLVAGLLREEGISAFVDAAHVTTLGPAVGTAALEGLKVLVPRSQLEQAHEILAEQDIPESAWPREVEQAYAQILGGTLAAPADPARTLELLGELRRDVRTGVLRRSVGAGPQARQVVLAMLSSGVQAGRLELVEDLAAALAWTGDGVAVLDLRTFLCGNKDVRLAVVRALSQVDHPFVQKVLVDCLDDSSPQVRDEALESLFARTGETFGFDPAIPLEDARHKIAVGKWHEFIARRSARLKLAEPSA
jgi:hypothetical protein